jgi:hypothetical protein
MNRRAAYMQATGYCRGRDAMPRDARVFPPPLRAGSAHVVEFSAMDAVPFRARIGVDRRRDGLPRPPIGINSAFS